MKSYKPHIQLHRYHKNLYSPFCARSLHLGPYLRTIHTELQLRIATTQMVVNSQPFPMAWITGSAMVPPMQAQI